MVLSPLLPPLLAAHESKHLRLQLHCLAARPNANPKATAHMKTKAKTKTTRTVRATIAVAIVSCISASSYPENPLEIDWSDFKNTVPVPHFREARAIAAVFHLNNDLAVKFPVLNGQINEGWQAHYKRPVHINDIILKPPRTSENSYEEQEIEWI